MRLTGSCIESVVTCDRMDCDCWSLSTVLLLPEDATLRICLISSSSCGELLIYLLMSVSANSRVLNADIALPSSLDVLWSTAHRGMVEETRRDLIVGWMGSWSDHGLLLPDERYFGQAAGFSV